MTFLANEFLGTEPKFRRRKKNSSLFAYRSSIKRRIRKVHVVASWRSLVEHLPPMKASHQCGPGSIPRHGVKCGLRACLHGGRVPRLTELPWESQLFIRFFRKLIVYILDRVTRLVGAPCLLAGGTLLGGLSFAM